jgi:glucose/arabinose dehydrogenase
MRENHRRAARHTVGLWKIWLALAVLALAASAFPAMAADEPGQRFSIRFQDLPAPGATPSARNAARAVRQPANATLAVPEGFKVNVFAEGLAHARWLAVSPNGDVFVAEPNAGRITLLRDSDNDGRADARWVFTEGLDRPHGMAFSGDYFYVTTPRDVFRIRYQPGDTVAAGPPELVGLQGMLGNGRGHWTRNIAFAPDGASFFVAVGSQGNIGAEPAPRATVQRFNLDGTGQTSFSSGLRNPVGIAFRPGSDDLYVVVNERDGLGDGLVPDFFTRIQSGDFFGWPYAYSGAHPAPSWGQRAPDLVALSKAPNLMFQAHSAPLGLVFYDGDQFPEAFRGDAFVALHGSWNAAQPTGYKVVRVPFGANGPASYYENFVTGFWLRGTSPAQVFGRPVGLAVAADGSLLIADDVSQTVWRVYHDPD